MAPTVAFITGANRGLGFAIAQKFAAKPNYVRSILIKTINDSR